MVGSRGSGQRTWWAARWALAGRARKHSCIRPTRYSMDYYSVHNGILTVLRSSSEPAPQDVQIRGRRTGAYSVDLTRREAVAPLLCTTTSLVSTLPLPARYPPLLRASCGLLDPAGSRRRRAACPVASLCQLLSFSPRRDASTRAWLPRRKRAGSSGSCCRRCSSTPEERGQAGAGDAAQAK